MKAPQVRRLDDPNAESVRAAHHEAIRELQELPAASLRVLSDITLADGIATPIAHGLPRAPVWAGPSVVRGAAGNGRIEEVRTGATDRARVIVLKASGYGATITIDLAVL